jgi:hypothetical protein
LELILEGKKGIGAHLTFLLLKKGKQAVGALYAGRQNCAE